MRKLPLLAIMGFVALGGASVVRSTEADAEPGTVVKAGDIRNAYGFYSLVFYFTPEPKVPAEETARELIRELFRMSPWLRALKIRRRHRSSASSRRALR